MTESEQKFANILGKLVVTIRERDSMGVGCIETCVAVAPSKANAVYNVIVKHIDFIKDSEVCAHLHYVYEADRSGKYIWVNGEKDNQYRNWFYVYNIDDLSLLTN